MELSKLPQVPLLVIVGSWQAEIFSRSFISNQLFPDETPIIEDVPPLPNVSVAFGLEDYRIQVQNDRIVFVVIKHSAGIEKEIIKRAVIILELLPYTPVRAFGINWHLKLIGISSAIFEKYRILIDRLSSKDYAVQSATSIFRLTKDNYAFNITLIASGIDFFAEINFDYQVMDTKAIATLLIPTMISDHEKEMNEILEIHLS